MDEELSTRKRICGVINREPGIHFQEIRRRLEMATGTLEHHLLYLEKQGVVTTKHDRYYKRYFPASMDRRDKVILSGMRQRNHRRIFVYLLLYPGSSHKEMMDDLGMKPSTLSSYLKELQSKDIVEREKSGRESLYRLRDEKRVERIFLSYRKSLLDDIVDSFTETWLEGFI